MLNALHLQGFLRLARGCLVRRGSWAGHGRGRSATFRQLIASLLLLTVSAPEVAREKGKRRRRAPERVTRRGEAAESNAEDRPYRDRPPDRDSKRDRTFPAA